MTYPPPEPGRQPDPPPADPFLSPPGWDQPYGHQPHGEQPYGDQPYGPSSPAYGPGSPAYGPSSPASPYGQPGSYGQVGSNDPSPYQPPQQYPPPGEFPPPGSAPPGYGGGPPPFGPYGGLGGPPPPRRPRRGLMIAGVVAAGALVLCMTVGVLGFVLLRDTDRDGEQSPTAAAQAFLQAVYRDHSADRASNLVCSQARDEEAMAEKIAQISAYNETYVEPSFSWSSPEVVEENGELATVATTVTMMTGDEKTADLPLHITVLDKGSNGWWVCDVETAPDTEAEPPPESGAPTEEPSED